MEKSLHQTAEERRAYISQIRSSFQSPDTHSASCRSQAAFPTEEAEETELPPSTLGIRTVIAILIFAAFVYCDQEKITYQDHTAKEVFSQIEWNPLPIDELLEEAERSKP